MWAAVLLAKETNFQSDIPVTGGEHHSDRISELN